MSRAHVVTALNHVLQLHARSLPVYLKDARPWRRVGDEPVLQLVDQIAADHMGAVDRLGALVLQRGGVPFAGEFPMVFTGYHDLSLDFLLNKMIERGERAQDKICEVMDNLADDPLAQAAVEELLGECKAHLDSLREAQQKRTQAA